MMGTPIPPVVKSVLVSTTVNRAFETFTFGMHSWWPPEHSLSPGSPRQAIIVEPRKGGRWYERAEDGKECDWGHVIVWDPPHRVVLAWQIDATWKFDPKFITEVEILFESKGPASTLVRLEHRNLERFGLKATDTRTGLDSDNGWQLGLRRYVAMLESPDR